MKKLILKIVTLFFVFYLPAEAENIKKLTVNEVSTTGRSVIIDNNVRKARNLALEDALYLASLKGGAKVEGFSSVSRDTIINDQSIIKPTSNILDFKIIDEVQTKEHFQIKILAIVGISKTESICNSKPINVTIFNGKINSDYSLPSGLIRSIHFWYEDFFEILKKQKSFNIIDRRDIDYEKLQQSLLNPQYDYNAIVNGLPKIEKGNYSMVPFFELTQKDLSNPSNNFSYLSERGQAKFANYKIILKFYKGSDFKTFKEFVIEHNVKFDTKTNFQFMRALMKPNIKQIGRSIELKTLSKIQEIIRDFNCTPLTSKISVSKNKDLYINLGSNQGIYNRQIGIVKSGYNSNFLKKSNNLVFYVTEVFPNKSKIIPLNEEIEKSKLDKIEIQFVE